MVRMVIIIIIVVFIISIVGRLDHTPLSRLANSYRLERDRTEVEGVRTEVESMEVGGELYPE